MENIDQERNETLTQETLSDTLKQARWVLAGVGEEGGKIAEEGAGFGDLKKDTEITADKILGEYFLSAFKRSLNSSPFAIQIEGLSAGERQVFNGSFEQSKHYITVDPLDASLNYKLKGETLGLPHSAIVGIFNKPNPTFADCVMAGSIDFRSGDTWIAEKGKGCFLNDKRCGTSGKSDVDIKNGIIIGEFYYPENRELLLRLFRGEKGWLRNPGSAAYEMSLVASGQADAFICDRQKGHELGAAYLLVTEAGGYACDLAGRNLSEREYRFNSQFPVILASTQGLALKILERADNPS